MKRRVVYLLIALMGLQIVLAPSDAFAVSDYDNVITVGKPIVICGDGTEFDVRRTYEQIIVGKGDSYFNSVWSDAKQYGSGWALVQTQGSLATPREVIMRVSVAPSTASAYFTDLYGYFHLDTAAVIGATIYCNDWSNPAEPKLEVMVNTSWATRELGYAYVPNASGAYPIYVNMPLTYPVDYEGASVPSSMPSAKYVAMGDSYSSGEGHSPFEVLTDVDGVNECHRSTQGYPRTLQSELDFDSMTFVACSGAVTHSVLHGGPGIGNWNEGAQIEALSSDTEAVTITIGGNDLGFRQVAERCSKQLTGYNGWDCSLDANLNDMLDYRLEALEGTAMGTIYGYDGHEIHSISEVIEAIETEAPNASIYIAGYPKIFGSSFANYESDVNAPGGGYCVAGVGVDFSYQDAQWMNGWADTLNGAISDAVAVAKLDGVDVEYVSPSAFNGHGLCDSDTPYLFDILPKNLPPDPVDAHASSLHPNADGMHLAYGMAFLLKMS